MLRALFLSIWLVPTVASADPNNQIRYVKSVELNVGQSMVVYGFRGDCGERPKNVDPNRTRATKLGVLSNGKWGVTKSKTCGGWTPAVEIIFTASKKGRETIKVGGDTIKVRVR
ncbi:MAG: hypothetical protein AB8B58_09295 [Roseobacter sp.]